MTTVAQTVAELRSALECSAKEIELLDTIERKLAALRACYRAGKEQFDDTTVAFLKHVSLVEDTLRQFVECLQEKSWVRTRDDAADLASRLHEFAERLSPHLVAKRAEKEVRELIERSKDLPFEAEAKADAEMNRKISHAARITRQCHRCKNRMVLRSSHYGMFWGCSLFPQCFARALLTKEEYTTLNPG